MTDRNVVEVTLRDVHDELRSLGSSLAVLDKKFDLAVQQQGTDLAVLGSTVEAVEKRVDHRHEDHETRLRRVERVVYGALALVPVGLLLLDQIGA